MSVKIVDYKLRHSLDGKVFFSLQLQGGVEIVKSASGNSYATAKTASMPTTFSEETCKRLIGSELPGRIEKIDCDPYEYTVQETGEVILLHHRYEYVEQEIPSSWILLKCINIQVMELQRLMARIKVSHILKVYGTLFLFMKGRKNI